MLPSVPLENLFFAVIFAVGVYLIVTSVLKSRGKRPEPASMIADTQQDTLKLSDDVFSLGKRTGLARRASALGARVLRDDPNTVEDRLRRSGWRYQSVADYYGSKILNGVLLFVVGAVVGIVLRLPLLLVVGLAVGGGLLGLFNADIEINKVIVSRRKAIYREMAWTVDRLAMMMESGQAFNTSVGNMLEMQARRAAAKKKGDLTDAQKLQFIAKGRGGLFMALLRDLSTGLYSGKVDKVKESIENVRASSPEIPELDTFLQLVHLNLAQGQPIVLQLRALAAAMRDQLTNEIEERRQKAEMQIVVITSAVVVPSLLLIIAGPLLLSLANFLPAGR